MQNDTGTSVSFDGVDDQMAAADSGVPGFTEYSVAIWVKTPSSLKDLSDLFQLTKASPARYTCILRYRSPSGNFEHLWMDTSGTLHSEIGTTVVAASTTYLVVGTAHGPGTPDAGELKLYVNGCLEVTANMGTTNPLANGPNFGLDTWGVATSSGGAVQGKGTMQNAAWWNRVLTAAEIERLYGSGVNYTGGGCYSTPSPDACSLEVSDDVLLIDSANGYATIGMPAAADAQNHLYFVKNIGPNVISLDPNGSEKIDDANSALLSPLDGVEIVSDGSAWWILSAISGEVGLSS